MNDSSRQRDVGSGNQHVLDYLKRMQVEDPGFDYAIEGGSELDLDGSMVWADSTSRNNYSYFGDTVRFESYGARGYRAPFACFTGVNHHAQPVLFGCALLSNESEASLVWVLKTWLQVMHSNAPVSITTDPGRVIQMAVSQVLPDTRHRFCRWSIFRQAKENVAHMYERHQAFDVEFKKCVNDAETIDGFESCWALIMEKYYLTDNEWLQSMYGIRHQWVPIYMRDAFFGELSTSDCDDVTNLYFDGFVDSSTTIQVLLKQYVKAMTYWLQRESDADLDTSSSTPLLKTPSPMEKQAAKLYTRKIFLKFQEELVETLANPATKIDESGNVATYRVAKFGEEHKAHTVKFNGLEMKSTCSCQMFEFSGLICRHTLSVFRAKNVLTLPSQYILNRWTRTAKTGDQGVEECPTLPSNSQESTTFRYSNLRHEAMKFVEEGAKSIHIYNVAMNALQEAIKKVSATKKKTLGSVNSKNLESEGRETQAIYCQSKDDKERKIRELKAELEGVNHQSDVYRSNLLTVLKDMEDEKLKLSVKVQNARLSSKE